jgi:hypothetical protein
VAHENQQPALGVRQELDLGDGRLAHEQLRWSMMPFISGGERWREGAPCEAVYAELVEPWLGSWAELRRTYARFQAGEVTQEQGAEEIQARLGKHGGDRRSEQARKDRVRNHTLDRKPASRMGDRDRTLARLRRDDPELAARVERGEITANAAAVDKGWRQPRTPYGDMESGWNRASDAERERFMDFIDRWLEERDRDGAA